MIFQSGTPQEKPNLLGRSAALASMGQALGNSPKGLESLLPSHPGLGVFKFHGFGGWQNPGELFIYISNEGSLFSRMFFNLQGGWPPETFMTPSAVFLFMRKQSPKV